MQAEESRNENMFIFTMNGLDIHGNMISNGNRSGWIYCICLKIVDTMKRVILLINVIER